MQSSACLIDGPSTTLRHWPYGPHQTWSHSSKPHITAQATRPLPRSISAYPDTQILIPDCIITALPHPSCARGRQPPQIRVECSASPARSLLLGDVENSQTKALVFECQSPLETQDQKVEYRKCYFPKSFHRVLYNPGTSRECVGVQRNAAWTDGHACHTNTHTHTSHVAPHSKYWVARRPPRHPRKSTRGARGKLDSRELESGMSTLGGV